MKAMEQQNADSQQVATSTVQTPTPSSNESSSPKRRHRWVWVVVLAAFALLFAIVVRHQTQATVAQASLRGAMGPVPVTTATAKVGDVRIYLDAIGTVTPVYTDTITAQVTGVITAVHYREGQFVRKGDALIDLDSRPYAAQLEQAQGTLEHDQQLLAQAQMDLDRYQQAWARNGIPRQTLEDQQKLVLQYRGTVKYDDGTVHYDEVQVGYCHITSPISGRVGLRLVDPGNLITANGTTALVVITQIQPITVVFTVAEDQLNEVLDQLRRGAKLPVEAWDRQMHTQLATGQLVTVDNQIDTTTGTVKLRATFDNRGNALFPNQFVNTRVPVKTLHDQVLVPSSAVQHNGENAFVYVIQNGQANMANVKPGVSESGMTAVDGIRSGDVVADSSFEKLQDGAKIAVSNVQLPSTSSETNAP
jgi:multidrug efflux system membrane fusion protein